MKKRIDGLKLQKQLQDEWCWSAVTTSLDRFLDGASSLTQCKTVSNELHHLCCGELAGEQLKRCNQTNTLHEPLDHLGWLAQPPIREPLRLQAVRREIDAGRPVCCYIRWRNSLNGHFVAITGYESDSHDVFVDDPLFPPDWRDYDRFSSHAEGDGYRHGKGIWFASFLLNSRRRVAGS